MKIRILRNVFLTALLLLNLFESLKEDNTKKGEAQS